MREEEDSLVSGMKGATGAILAIFIIFVIAPCAVCGGMATCGHVLQEAETQDPDPMKWEEM